MRIVGGKMRGRRLRSPASGGLRPTSDRIRESIFDLLGPGRSGYKVLDLFAGTGALGIEALSRGYTHVVFVDYEARAIRLIEQNVGLCKIEEACRIEKREAIDFLAESGNSSAFDLVFADPPYRRGLLDGVMVRLSQRDWLAGGGVVVCESEAGLELEEDYGPLARFKHRRYGDTALHLYHRARADRSPQ